MSLIKKSAKLTKAYDQMMKFAIDNDYGDWDSDCDFFAWADYAIGGEADQLFRFLNRAHKTGQSVYSLEQEGNVVLYLGTETECLERIKTKFQEMKDHIDANNKANVEAEKQFKAKRAEVLKKELVRLGKELQKLTAE